MFFRGYKYRDFICTLFDLNKQKFNGNFLSKFVVFVKNNKLTNAKNKNGLPDRSKK